MNEFTKGTVVVFFIFLAACGLLVANARAKSISDEATEETTQHCQEVCTSNTQTFEKVSASSMGASVCYCRQLTGELVTYAI